MCLLLCFVSCSFNYFSGGCGSTRCCHHALPPPRFDSNPFSLHSPPRSLFSRASQRVQWRYFTIFCCDLFVSQTPLPTSIPRHRESSDRQCSVRTYVLPFCVMFGFFCALRRSLFSPLLVLCFDVLLSPPLLHSHHPSLTADSQCNTGYPHRYMHYRSTLTGRRGQAEAIRDGPDISALFLLRGAAHLPPPSRVLTVSFVWIRIVLEFVLFCLFVEVGSYGMMCNFGIGVASEHWLGWSPLLTSDVALKPCVGQCDKGCNGT